MNDKLKEEIWDAADYIVDYRRNDYHPALEYYKTWYERRNTDYPEINTAHK